MYNSKEYESYYAKQAFIRSMKWVVVGVLVLLTIVSLAGAALIDLAYDRNVGGYLHLADDASMATVKLQYLKQYRDAVVLHVPADGNACYIFRTPQTSVRAQMNILESLIARVEQVASMDPQSLEYQQGMLQITDQEFGGAIATTDHMLSNAWLRANPIRFIGGIGGLPIIFGICVIIAFVVAAG